jgi:hypothetical protein
MKKRTRIEFQRALMTTAIASQNAPTVMRALRQLTGPQRSKGVPSITYTKMVGVTGAIPASASTDLHLAPAVHTLAQHLWTALLADRLRAAGARTAVFHSKQFRAEVWRDTVARPADISMNFEKTMSPMSATCYG